MFKKLLAVLFCVVFLVSCSEPLTLPEFIVNIGAGANYDGKVITIYNEEGSVFAYADDNSLQADAVWNRIADVEKKLNVKFEYSNKGSSDFRTYYITTLAGGLGEIDLIYRASGNDLWFVAEAGGLHPITDFPEFIDLSDTDKYGTPGVLEACMHNGIPYAVQPTYWPGLQGVECFYVSYNRDMIAAMGLTDLHEYYENETWTWDTFKSVLDTAAPIIESPKVIFNASGGFLLNTLFMSNGFDYITINNGEVEMELAPAEAIHAVEFLKSLHEYGDKIDVDTDRWDVEAFYMG
ncbi:MAG: extracellular solute-binding protein, partial [Clostridia bacterium]|nr:extracellular solute-binding protein [Clostridia bacterium]